MAISRIFTLGPPGTNLEVASHEWFRRQGYKGEVELFSRLEEGLEIMPRDGSTALVACAVYPYLHELVFSNLSWLTMVDCFLLPTQPMVLASRSGRGPELVSTHPAPRLLSPADVPLRLVNSNTQAALDCQAGLSDACVTTLAAAERHDLIVLKDYGAIPMVFTVHAPCSSK